VGCARCAVECRRPLARNRTGPAALREAGLVETLRAHWVRVADHGDLPVARWAADRTDEWPNAWRLVVDVVDAARSVISEVVRVGQAPLVLGGECTLAIALVAALVEHYGDVGMMYVDGGQDLMIPVVEANPDHGPDGTSIRRLVTAVAAALAEPVS
jgi:arginase